MIQISDPQTRIHIWRVNFNQLYLTPELVSEYPIETEFDLPKQRVIHSDVERTRTSFITQEERYNLELLLTYYCKQEDVTYKQGMNEICIPFIIMIRDGLTLTESYEFFKAFVNKYLKSMFKDSVTFTQQFKPLQAIFPIFKLLLKYHEPRLCSFLQGHCIIPESFATPWFITLFASKVKEIDILLALWEILLEDNDTLLPCFLAVAFLFQHKLQIQTHDPENLQRFINQLTISTVDQLQDLITIAKDFRKNLPYSVLIKLQSLDIANLETIDQVAAELQSMCCFQIHPREIIHRIYPQIDFCSCKNRSCQWCSKIEQQIPLLIMDCRTQLEQEGGILPNTILMDYQAYKDEEIMLEATNQFFAMKGEFHIALLGSGSFRYSNFDLSMDTSDKEVDFVQNMLENLIIDFNTKGFPYISVIEGGFNACHDLALKLKQKIDRHKKDRCLSCKFSGNRQSMKKKILSMKKLIMGRVRRAFSSNSPKPDKQHRASTPPPSVKSLENVVTKRQLDQWREDPLVSFFSCCHYNTNTKEADRQDRIMIIARDQMYLVNEINDLQSHHPEIQVCTILDQFNLANLIKITSKKHSPTFLSFYFKEEKKQNSFCYILRNQKEAKKCIDILGRNYKLKTKNS